jgi:hypothetical protein
MEQSFGRYVLSFQTEPFRRGVRYHWMVCRTQKPDELVSWGHAPTQEQAEKAARTEAEALSSGLSQGGQVSSTIQAFTHRRPH